MTCGLCSAGTVSRCRSDRRQQLVEQCIAAVNRLPDVLQDLVPGRESKRLTASKELEILVGIRPGDAEAAR